MGADNGTHYVGDKVTPSKNNLDSRLEQGKVYTITRINRGIDGAYDFDDIYLGGVSGSICEFILDTVERGPRNSY